MKQVFKAIEKFNEAIFDEGILLERNKERYYYCLWRHCFETAKGETERVLSHYGTEELGEFVKKLEIEVDALKAFQDKLEPREESQKQCFAMASLELAKIIKLLSDFTKLHPHEQAIKNLASFEKTLFDAMKDVIIQILLEQFNDFEDSMLKELEISL